MAGNIKGITIEIGGDTTKLEKALKNVNNTSRSLNSQLKDIDKALKFNPGNTELIAQKQRVLSESVENTKNKLEVLREAHTQASRQLAEGKIGQEEFDALTREIIKTENELKSFEGNLRRLNSTVYQMGEKIGEFGKKSEELGQKLSPVSAIAGSALAALTGLAVGATKTADDINTLSKVTGVSVESLQKFKMAEDIIDVSTETMAKSLAKLTKSMDGADKGAKNQVQAFEELGVSIKDAKGNFRDNEDVFNDVINALSKIENETKRDAIAFNIFGKSAQDLNPLILGGSAALKEIGDRAEQAGIIMSQEAIDNINVFNNELDMTKAVVTQAGLQLGASVGQVMLPILQSLAKSIQGLAQNLSKMDPAMIKVMLGVLALVASIAPLLIMIGKIATGVSALITLFSAGGAGATALSTEMTILTGPIGIIIGLLTALSIAFVVLYKNNEDFRNKVQEVWEYIQEFISNVVEEIKNIIDDGLKLINEFWDEHKEEITALAKALWDLISSIIKIAIDKITKVVKIFIEAFKGFWKIFGDDITKIAKNTWDGINKVISGVIQVIQGIITAFTGFITGDFNKFGQGLKTATEGIWKAVSGIFETAIKNLKSLVRAGLDAIIDFFKKLKLPEIKIPKIKLPHFKINGSFSINPPSVPSFNVDWYKNGGIFTKPTIFSTPYGLKGIGEAGAEAVLPLSYLDKLFSKTIKNLTDMKDEVTINFSISDIVIRNENDIDILTQKITDKLIRQIKNRKIEGTSYRI